MSLRVSLALTVVMAGSLMAEVDWRFAHPQSELLIGVRIKPLLESPLGDVFREQTKTMGPQMGGKLDLLDEIEEVYISAVSKRGKNGKVTDSDGVVLLVGDFDGGKLMKLLQGADFQKAGQEKLVPRFVDRRTILLGDEDAMVAAIERMKDPTKKRSLFTNPLFDRAQDLDSEHDIWVVGSAAPISGATGPAEGAFGFLNDLRSFSFALGMRDQMRLDIGLNMKTRKGAEEMIGMFTSIQTQMRKQMKDPSQWDKIAEQLKVTTTGTSVRMQMAMDAREIREGMNQVLAARKEAATGALLAKAEPQPVAKPVVPTPPPPPMRRTVIVYGQETGPREIQVLR